MPDCLPLKGTLCATFNRLTPTPFFERVAILSCRVYMEGDHWGMSKRLVSDCLEVQKLAVNNEAIICFVLFDR